MEDPSNKELLDVFLREIGGVKTEVQEVKVELGEVSQKQTYTNGKVGRNLDDINWLKKQWNEFLMERKIRKEISNEEKERSKIATFENVESLKVTNIKKNIDLKTALIGLLSAVTAALIAFSAGS